MLKLNASYSKKVLAQEEYSSQCYHLSLELELPDGLSKEQLNDRIAQTFAHVREAVESEIHSAVPTYQGSESPASQPRKQTQTIGFRPSEPAPEEPFASSKQISFLTSLAKQKKKDIRELIQVLGVNNLYHLSRRQCTRLIEELKAA